MTNSDKQDNDEYQFADLDSVSPDRVEEDTLVTEKSAKADEFTSQSQDNDKQIDIMRKNVIIVVGLIFALVIFYRVYHWFSAKPIDTPPATPIVKVQPYKPLPVENTSNTDVNTLKQNLSSLEDGTNKVQNDISMLTSQMQDMSAQLTSLTAELATVNASLNSANDKITAQEQAIKELIAMKKRTIKRQFASKNVAPMLVYYLKAIIPGRAWIMSTNGSAMTVSLGTTIPGYGRVTVIDPEQGKVGLSSGRVINFSPEDN